MSDSPAIQRFAAELAALREQGLFKSERIIRSPQAAEIVLADGREVLNFCANNYLGLADHPDVIAAAKDALDSHGFGMASVRFICGTQDLHKQLEAKVADFFGMNRWIGVLSNREVSPVRSRIWRTRWAGKCPARASSNFFSSTGMPSPRRLRWPIG